MIWTRTRGAGGRRACIGAVRLRGQILSILIRVEELRERCAEEANDRFLGLQETAIQSEYHVKNKCRSLQALNYATCSRWPKSLTCYTFYSIGHRSMFVERHIFALSMIQWVREETALIWACGGTNIVHLDKSSCYVVYSVSLWLETSCKIRNTKTENTKRHHRHIGGITLTCCFVFSEGISAHKNKQNPDIYASTILYVVL